MNDTPQRKKLIEVALPLAEINVACKADKVRKHGTIRNLHKWFAPMPLPSWRALLFAALVDDPGDDEKRAYLLDLIKRLVKNGGEMPDTTTLQEAREVLLLQFGDAGLPTVFDPFCGGGSTLVEGQRLGLPTAGSDLNPVPVLITRTLTELLPSVHGVQPLHPEAARSTSKRRGAPASHELSLLPESQTQTRYSGYSGLARDVAFYADIIAAEARVRLQENYPTRDGETIVAWLWARTARCPNPACRIETLLTTSWWVSQRKGFLAWIEPRIEAGQVVLDVVSGRPEGSAPEPPKLGRGAAFACLGCGSVLTEDAIIAQGLAGELGTRMTCVAYERAGARGYRAPDSADILAADSVLGVEDLPEILLPNNPRWFSGPRFGFNRQSDLYTPRQLMTLAVISDLVAGLPEMVQADGGTEAWATAVTTLLGLGVGRLAAVCSTQSQWRMSDRQHAKAEHAFTRNDLPMMWDWAETNPFGTSVGSWVRAANKGSSVFDLVTPGTGVTKRVDARTSAIDPGGLVATDPPYFDAIGYADLSDYFYVWHRRALSKVQPDLFPTIAAPKAGELVAVPTHHGNSKEAAQDYFIQGFTETFRNLQGSMAPGLPMLVVYASKEQKGGAGEETRWSSILTAMIQADLEITGTWPIHGTGATRMIGQGTNSVASYVAMVCRPRRDSSGKASLADFNRELRRELRPAVHNLQAAGILPVDLAQAAMGPGMQIYSRHSEVLDQSGARVPVDAALRLINAALGEVLDEQEGELDSYSRFAVAWWEKYGWSAAAFGEADQLARPQGISVDDVVRAGVAHYPKAGYVALLGGEELPRTWVPATDNRPTAWEAVHHLADRLIDGGGAAEAGRLMGQLSTLRDSAQALVYRLHAVAAQKGRTKDQERYNALIGSWSDLLALSATEKDGLF